MGMQIMAYGGSPPAPFQQAICESQALEPGITGNYTTTAWAQVIGMSPCNSSDPNSNSTLECLRSLSLETLLNITIAQYNSDGSNLGDIWLPHVDGDFLPEAPSKLIADGQFNKMTTMMGWTQNDATYFTDTSITTSNDTKAAIHSYLPNLNSTNLSQLLALYPVTNFSTDPSANLSAEFYRTARIIRDTVFVSEPFLWAAAMAKASQPTYHYIQNQTFYTPALDSLGQPGLGVIHTSEFAYVFGNLSHYNVSGLPFEPRPEDYALKSRQSRSWSTFAWLGRPELEGKDTFKGWKPAVGDGDESGVFVIGGSQEGWSSLSGNGSRVAVAEQKLSERCAFLNRGDVIAQLGF